jgi:PhoPQ-activated pathogenicity-related protein
MQDPDTNRYWPVHLAMTKAVVKLWVAQNPNTRDFRYSSNIRYSAQLLRPQCTMRKCHYPVKLAKPEKGWQASFVEVSFELTPDKNFVLTTPVFVAKESKDLNHLRE